MNFNEDNNFNKIKIKNYIIEDLLMHIHTHIMCICV